MDFCLLKSVYWYILVKVVFTSCKSRTVSITLHLPYNLITLCDPVHSSVYPCMYLSFSLYCSMSLVSQCVLVSPLCPPMLFVSPQSAHVSLCLPSLLMYPCVSPVSPCIPVSAQSPHVSLCLPSLPMYPCVCPVSSCIPVSPQSPHASLCLPSLPMYSCVSIGMYPCVFPCTLGSPICIPKFHLTTWGESCSLCACIRFFVFYKIACSVKNTEIVQGPSSQKAVTGKEGKYLYEAM